MCIMYIVCSMQNTIISWLYQGLLGGVNITAVLSNTQNEYEHEADSAHTSQFP